MAKKTAKAAIPGWVIGLGVVAGIGALVLWRRSAAALPRPSTPTGSLPARTPASPPPAPPPPARTGLAPNDSPATASQIKNFQRLARQWGIAIRDADGVYGPDTRAAVIRVLRLGPESMETRYGVSALNAGQTALLAAIAGAEAGIAAHQAPPPAR